MREILGKLAEGKISVEEAERRLRLLAISEVEDMAKLDVGRELRTGSPEIILAEGKTLSQLRKVVSESLTRSGRAIVSRATSAQIGQLTRSFSKGCRVEGKEEYGIAVFRRGDPPQRSGGVVGILTAGSADIRVAEEARIAAEEMGCSVIPNYDVGVAGIHRVFPALKKMLSEGVDVVVVVAGREGALPTVVGGLVDLPVIAVPTSVGYGLGEKGIAALMAMLQSCSLGLAVVNIDAGVAAGIVAARIANRCARARSSKLEGRGER